MALLHGAVRSKRKDNLPSATEEVPCPDCGFVTTLRGLSAHKRGKRCEVGKNVRQRAERGLDFVERPLDQLLGKCGIPFETALATYEQGKNPPFEPKLGVGFFAEAEIVAHVKLVWQACWSV